MTLSLQEDNRVDGVVWERMCEHVAALVGSGKRNQEFTVVLL